MKTALRATCLAALLCLGACGSYRSYDLDGCRLYGGVRYDCGDTTEHWSDDAAFWATVASILRFPFDLAVDTACLPFTAVHVLLYGEPEAR